VFLLFLLLSVQATFARNLERSECADQDLSKEFGPVHNQYDRGWCWGLVAQDLMSFTAGRTNDPYATQDIVATTLTTKPEDLRLYAEKQSEFNAKSQAKLAASLQKPLLTLQQGKKPALRANGIHTAIVAYSARGEYCATSESQLWRPGAWGADRAKKPKAFVDYLSVANLSLVPESLRAMKQLKESKPKTPTDIQFEFSELLPRCDSPVFGAHKFADMRASLNEKALADFKTIVDKACQSRKPGPEFVPQTRDYDEPVAGDNATNVDLAQSLKNGVPVGINYNAGFLKKGAPRGAEYGHTSIVVGTRWNEADGSCEFKIRNSWGGDCSIYQDNYAKAENCDKGNVWVSEIDVLESVRSATTVRKK
jgi:hypothetical protein